MIRLALFSLLLMCVALFAEVSDSESQMAELDNELKVINQYHSECAQRLQTSLVKLEKAEQRFVQLYKLLTDNVGKKYERQYRQKTYDAQVEFTHILKSAMEQMANVLFSDVVRHELLYEKAKIVEAGCQARYDAFDIESIKDFKQAIKMQSNISSELFIATHYRKSLELKVFRLEVKYEEHLQQMQTIFGEKNHQDESSSGSKSSKRA